MRETHGYFDIGGARLEFLAIDPAAGAAPTLVLLHEGLGCVAMWKDFPRRLAVATGCSVLAYSRAGYGGSTPCPLPRSPGFMHDEGLKVLPRVLDAAAIRQAILIGHSDGASIALINAGGTADPRIVGLVLMAPHVFVETLTVSSIREAHAAYRTTGLRERLARYHGDQVDATFLGWAAAWLDGGFLAWNIEAYLPRVAVPVLLIQGEQDNYGTLRQLDAIQAQVPGATERLLLTDCGHAPFRDRPAETLQAIAGFIAKLAHSEALGADGGQPGASGAK